ncbi:MAG: hypothetical protein Q8O12_03065 [Candidatus Omnitrophota bacterium]|nr:hypothetical protein [Candidatus Omnitrophota bacterium]
MQKTFNFFYAFLLALVGIGATLMAEDITLTTYYPAPYGAYEELTTTSTTSLATTSGNVGIGTTDPKNKLGVEGGVAIGTGYSGTSTAPSNGLIVQGQVGIGTTSPAAGTVLDVNGTVKATNYYSSDGSVGVTGTFVATGKQVQVENGIITYIEP